MDKQLWKNQVREVCENINDHHDLFFLLTTISNACCDISRRMVTNPFIQDDIRAKIWVKQAKKINKCYILNQRLSLSAKKLERRK